MRVTAKMLRDAGWYKDPNTLWYHPDEDGFFPTIGRVRLPRLFKQAAAIYKQQMKEKACE